MADYQLHTLRGKSFYIFLFPFEETCPTLAFKQIQLLPNCALLCSTRLEKKNCCIKLLHSKKQRILFYFTLSLFQTFCVVSRRFKKHFVQRYSATRSIFIFAPWNKFRSMCVYLSSNQYFDYVVMLTILVNCIFLAKQHPVEEAE